MKTTTTTTFGKIEKSIKSQPKLPVETERAYTRKELAQEVVDLTGEIHDPAYLAEIANGGRRNKRLTPFIKKAVANLVARRHAAQSKTL